LNQFLQYRQSHQLHTTIHLSISTILAPPARAPAQFFFDRYFNSIFPLNRAPTRAHVFRASFTLFRGIRPAPLSTAARDLSFRFWLYRYMRSIRSPRVLLSIFRYFNMLIRIKLISQVSNGILSL
jgi:hypothetical protein